MSIYAMIADHIIINGNIVLYNEHIFTSITSHELHYDQKEAY